MTALIDLNVDGYYILEPHKMPVFHSTNHHPPLEMLQEMVGGGLIEVVYLKGGKAHGVINEDGKMKGFQPNPLASALYGNPHDYIVGTMIVCCGKARLK